MTALKVLPDSLVVGSNSDSDRTITHLNATEVATWLWVGLFTEVYCISQTLHVCYICLPQCRPTPLEYPCCLQILSPPPPPGGYFCVITEGRAARPGGSGFETGCLTEGVQEVSLPIQSVELTWKWRMAPWKTIFHYKQVVFHFHVSFWECILWRLRKIYRRF